jgi:simple sugar transport system permease protein
VVLGELLAGTLGSSAGIGQVLFKATPLLFTGVAVDFALRGGLFNIGAEGQVAVASLAVGLVGMHLAVGTPAPVAIAILVAVAALAGAAWAFVPALLRARFGAHEVVSTLLMNRVADVVVTDLLARGLALPGTMRLPDVVPGARLPRLSVIPGLSALAGTAVSVALPLAIAVAFAGSYLARRWRLAREIGLVGKNAEACRAEGIPVGWRRGQALVLSGALAGLAATSTVLGYKGYFEQGLGAGVGFGGLAVALLGRGQPLGMVLAALLFATLDQGGLAVNARVPMDLATVLEAVVIVVVAADTRVLGRPKPARRARSA